MRHLLLALVLVACASSPPAEDPAPAAAAPVPAPPGVDASPSPAPVSGSLSATLDAQGAWVFNGVARAWGEDFVYALPAGPKKDDVTMGALSGVPVVDVWTPSGGVAFMNLAPHMEAMRVVLDSDGAHVTVTVSGGSELVRFEHAGDYGTALREFATRMAARGMAAQRAPDWAFAPQWETYGFEESWTADDVLGLLPVMKDLGIGSVTFDSGTYGTGTDDWDARNGDYPINPDTVGDEQAFKDLVARLHAEGLRARLWWSPGVGGPNTQLHQAHPDWFLSVAKTSSDDSTDRYLDPENPAVVAWNRSVVERFVSYGLDGFKQDDVFEIFPAAPGAHAAYSKMFADIFATARAKKPDFAINTCNCGVAQNFYDFPGENMLITSDPNGARQVRLRAKAYQALNVGGAAILGDHVELTKGDDADLDAPGFYDTVDFASVVPLGLVLQTKFTKDPGARYRLWFDIYRRYRFFAMRWVNVPYFGGTETYLLSDGATRYASFFDSGDKASVTIPELEAGRAYEARKLETGELVGTFTAEATTHRLAVQWRDSLVLEVKPAP